MSCDTCRNVLQSASLNWGWLTSFDSVNIKLITYYSCFAKALRDLPSWNVKWFPVITITLVYSGVHAFSEHCDRQVIDFLPRSILNEELIRAVRGLGIMALSLRVLNLGRFAYNFENFGEGKKNVVAMWSAAGQGRTKMPSSHRHLTDFHGIFTESYSFKHLDGTWCFFLL